MSHRWVVLAGGVGGARLCHGFYRVGVPLTIVANTGDDFRLHGLWICPDLDTLMYTLAERADKRQGWGLEGETWQVARRLEQLGGETWFRLGDGDLATHLFRTQALSHGQRLTTVTARLCAAHGLPEALLLPMSDKPSPTRVRSESGWLDFQDYFVRQQHRPRVLECSYAPEIRPTDEVLQALSAADRLLLAPSNPFLSLLPLFALQGFASAWDQCIAPKVGVSPIIGGKAVKGPLGELLPSLGFPCNSLGVALALRGRVDHWVIDVSEASLRSDIESLGCRVSVLPTWMGEVAEREELARRLCEL